MELDVAVGGDVRGDATVGTVGPSAASNGALDTNVGDHAFLGVEALSLSVALKIEQELADGLA